MNTLLNHNNIYNVTNYVQLFVWGLIINNVSSRKSMKCYFLRGVITTCRNKYLWDKMMIFKKYMCEIYKNKVICQSSCFIFLYFNWNFLNFVFESTYYAYRNSSGHLQELFFT